MSKTIFSFRKPGSKKVQRISSVMVATAVLLLTQCLQHNSFQRYKFLCLLLECL